MIIILYSMQVRKDHLALCFWLEMSRCVARRIPCWEFSSLFYPVPQWICKDSTWHRMAEGSSAGIHRLQTWYTATALCGAISNLAVNWSDLYILRRFLSQIPLALSKDSAKWGWCQVRVAIIEGGAKWGWH